MSTTSNDARQQSTFDEVPLVDTDIPVTAHTDHMGRPHAASIGDAFRQD